MLPVVFIKRGAKHLQAGREEVSRDMLWLGFPVPCNTFLSRMGNFERVSQ
jgi:hypothetical protein